MTSILKSFIALYTSMLLLAMSLGLLATFLSLRLTIEGFSTQMTGLILTSYFVGSVVGAIYGRRIIRSVGHIRAFAVFAALATAMIMLHGFYISALAWAIFRFFTGIATIGLFMVIESWFNESAEPHTRGRVFSIYMVMCYLGGSIGQQLLNLGEVKDQTLFFVIGFLLVSCIIPIALTHSIHPEIPKVKPVKFKIILQKAPLGILGCFTAGLTNSSFYTMGPVFSHQINLSISQISYFMTISVLGGLLFQWPLGIFSDRFDRSKVIPILGIVFAVVSVLMIGLSQSSFWVFMAATALFAGLMFTIYPAAVARAHDMFEPKDVVNVSSALLLFYGIGAVIGPIVSSSVMEMLDSPYGFYIYFSGVSTAFALISLFLRHKELARVIPVEDQVDFMIMNHTTQMAIQIDPRSEVDQTQPEKKTEDELTT
ncbi:MAG: MFS transporter [Desulfobacula sp.]|jgi:MFS family permease|uniref:MFS transporter n=2 Tax=Desulfobacula sp. TaxID=2593537 RepID=UPI001DD79010|nr:MFS transporter [Desulfobacula sp.]MBT3806222.1 MFS transporter [Desulfobacula sp.]MBT4199352.1 MFS transporter [Desulfobacula sp.]MBT4507129.1 MFS transporter [Desulfobacula sp.]MBT5544893.1 MFS transporter [Desulfobacula sp.]